MSMSPLVCLKTTLEVPDALWNDFAMKALEKEKKSGKRNAIVLKLIKGYLEGRFQVRA